MAMKKMNLDLIIKTCLAIMLSLSSLPLRADDGSLTSIEKKTVNFMNTMSQNGNLKVDLQNAQYLAKDTQYMDSHQRDSIIAKINEDQTATVVNTMSKQLFRAFFGVYEEEIKIKILTVDLSDDDVAASNVGVTSYDRRNFELTMMARKNKERLAQEQGVASGSEDVKAKWKIRPRIGSSPGVNVGYLSTQFNLEMRMTTAEQAVNLHRSLKDIAVDLFYNIDLKHNESSLTLSKPVAKSLNLQVQSISRGVNAFDNADERVSLNFGRVF